MKSLITRLVLLGAVSIIALGGAEVLLRVFRLAPTGGVYTVTAREYETVPGIFSPNQRTLDRRIPELSHRVTINSLGFRGREIAAEKPSGEFRILFAGDSFVYGDFVDDEETLPAQLELRLREQCGDVRVINAGLGGSTITEQKHVVRRGLALEPDLIILLFSENDIDDLRGTSLWERLARNRESKSRFPFSLAYSTMRGTALWNLALHAMAVRRAQAAAPDVNPAPAQHDEDDRRRDQRLRDEYRTHLLALRDTLRSRELPLVFTAYPSHYSVPAHEPAELIEWVTDLARESGIPVHDILDDLRSAGLPVSELYLLPLDGHPSRVGYGLASAGLTDRLQALPPLAPRCEGGGSKPAPRSIE